MENLIGINEMKLTDNNLTGKYLGLKRPPAREFGQNEMVNILKDEGGESLYNYTEWLGVINEPDFIVLSSRHHYYYDKEDLNNVSTVVTIKQLNHINNLGEFFQTIFRLIPSGSKLIGSYAENKRNNNSYKKNEVHVNGSFTRSEALDNGIIVRNPLLNMVFSLFDSGTNRQMAKKGFIQQLESNGFKILDITELNGFTYFCAQKVQVSVKKRIFLSSPHMSGGEIKYINDAFEQNWVAPVGPHVDAFEKSISDLVGVKHTAVLSSGTAAIHLSLLALGIKKGDHVITSSFTFAATVNPVVYLGAVPVLVDSEPETWNMDPHLLEQAICDLNKKGIKPKAIIPVHLYGMPAKMDEIVAIANHYDIPIVEDSAEALGSKYKNQYAGSFGKMGIFSFNGNKIITTSGGGALVSDDKELIDKAKFLASQAKDPAPHYQHSQIGYNYRMSNILAGIGLGQIEVLNQRVQQRRENHDFYVQNLKDIPGIRLLKEPDRNYFSNFWLNTILIDSTRTDITREQLLYDLEKENIETRPLWKPMHMQPVFAGCPAYVNGTSENLFKMGLCLPSGSNLSDDDRSRIISILYKKLRIK